MIKHLPSLTFFPRERFILGSSLAGRFSRCCSCEASQPAMGWTPPGTAGLLGHHQNKEVSPRAFGVAATSQQVLLTAGWRCSGFSAVLRAQTAPPSSTEEPSVRQRQRLGFQAFPPRSRFPKPGALFGVSWVVREQGPENGKLLSRGFSNST